MAWSLALRRDDAKQDPVVYGAEFGVLFKVKSMVKKFGVEKAKRTPAFSGVPTLSSSE